LRAGEVFQAGLGALFDQGGFEPKTNRSQSGHFQPSLMAMATTTPLLARVSENWRSISMPPGPREAALH
jgi:hypothetical protein